MNHLLDFIKELSFVRIGGSAEERQAAERILKEVNLAAEEAGREDIKGSLMPFSIPSAQVKRCTVSAAGRELFCAPLLRQH